MFFTKENFTWDNQNLRIEPLSFKIDSQGEQQISLSYRPLLVQTVQFNLTISHENLGVSQYKIQVVGNPTTESEVLKFETYLSLESHQTFSFTNYFKNATSYQIQIKSN